jgi:lipid II:glycine glycyltransferase (peptidoglycan interpeptide bridge formation enzyme)
MSSDDLTRNMTNADEEDKDTQPTITAVFRLLQDVECRLNARLDGVTARLDETEARFNARLDKTDARLDEIESRLARDIEGVNTRVTEVNTRVTDGFKELIHKTKALNRRALQSEADYEDLSERIERLESKAS